MRRALLTQETDWLTGVSLARLLDELGWQVDSICDPAIRLARSCRCH
ncbi:MAG: hypothetical protein AAF558_03760 [Verrucomicrobiota bacterium]